MIKVMGRMEGERNRMKNAGVMGEKNGEVNE